MPAKGGKGAGGGGGGGAVRAGRAFVELFADDNKLTRTLDGWKKKLNSWAKTTAKVGLASAGVGGGILAPITGLFTEALSRSDQLDTLGKRLGATTETVSTLATGFERAGVGMDEFGGFLDGLNGKITSAATANTALIDGLASMPQLNGRALLGMGLDQQLDTIAEAIRKITLDADKADIASSLGLTKLLPWLKKGKAGLDELREAGKKGLVTTEEGEQAKAVMAAYTESWQAVKYAALEVGTALFGTAGDISKVSESIKTGSKAAGEWIRENRGIVVGAAAVGAVLVTAGVALGVFASLLSAIGTVAGVASAGVALFGTAVGLVFSPAGLLLAGLAAGAVGFVTLTGAGQESFDALTDGSEEFTDAFKTGWAAVLAAVNRGDLEGAFSVICATMELAWAKAIDAMTQGWVKLKQKTVPALEDIREYIAASIIDEGKYLGLLSGDDAKGMKDYIRGDMRQAGDAERDETSRRQLDESARRLDEARQKMKAVLEQEADKEEKHQREKRDRNKPPGGAGDPAKAAVVAAGKAAESARQLFDSQKGIFGGPIKAQLGYGDSTAQRQLDAQEDIARNAKVLPEILRATQQFNNPRFK